MNITYQSQPLQHGSVWFDDGNIILLPDSDSGDAGVAFRVHRGVMTRHSEVFKSMFEIPQPNDEYMESFDGCPIVRMVGDRPNELEDFIKALYDGVVFEHRNIDDFFYVAGILRLATKYFVHRLRLQAIQHLTKTWSYTLDGHDAMVSRALSAPTIGNSSYPYVHPLHVLNLARETHVTIILPAVLYFLSIYSLEDILRADHPKLVVAHPSAPTAQLSPDSLRDYTLMYQHRLSLMLEFIHTTCGDRSEDKQCQGEPRQCKRAFIRLTYQIANALTVRTGVFHNMLQAIGWVDADDTVCITCKRAFSVSVRGLREQWWAGLPAAIGFPDWETLVAMDLMQDPPA